MSIIQGNAIAAEGGYQIERSLRFNSADSAYLNRTPASAGNRRTWTWSGWVKRSALGSINTLFGQGTGTVANGYGVIRFYNGSVDSIEVLASPNGSVNSVQWTSTAVYRDPSAFYHVVVALDTTQATGANRLKVFVNGVQIVGTFGTTPTQNADIEINRAAAHQIGVANASGLSGYFNGYLTEINFIDGQALTPTSFGEFNPITGVWQPKKYTGTYGTNGFYLNFSDNSGTTSTTLGKDSSGNGNNWTPNNFSVTAGAGNDSLVDTPTPYGVDTGAGGTVRGNYATLNPLEVTTGTYTFSNGNLNVSTTGGSSGAGSTISVSSGKWYWEQTITAIATTDAANAGIRNISGNPQQTGAFSGGVSGSYIYRSDGNKRNNATTTSYGASFTTNDVIGVALDLDAGTLVFYKNGVSQGTAYSSLSGTFEPMVSGDQSSGTTSYAVNFGQRPFAYTAPSGFKALVTTNLPAPTIEKGGEYFNPVLYSGTGATQSITGVGFQPDWVWIKRRSGTSDHGLVDAVRGRALSLYSNLTSQEFSSGSTQDVTSFDSDGFSLGTQLNFSCNASGSTYVAWNWKANGAGVSNTDGTITSTVSANTTSGFSIVTYTGTGANATVGHGLGVAPRMMIVKCRSTGGVSKPWAVYHASFGAPANNYMFLNATDAVGATTGYWNTGATSTTFGVANYTAINTLNDTYVAYCFAEVPGFSAFGSYTGNGSADGPFIYTGFRPRYVLIKRTNTTNEWIVYDSARDPVNATTLRLFPNNSNAESANDVLDLLSNGFKLRSTITNTNASGSNYIFACFAENPFKYSLAR